MTLIAIILICILIFCGGSILGWILNVLGWIVSFLFDGFCHLLGCFGWIIIMIIAIGAIIALFNGIM